jgi:hypothetical protein
MKSLVVNHVRLVLLLTIGLSAFLQFQLRMKMKQLKVDDQVIQREGVDSQNYKQLLKHVV